MSKDERKETVDRIAEKFASLPENQKSFIAGYMARAEEEYSVEDKEKKQETTVATATA